MVDTSQSPALGVMVTVPDRSAETLLPIVQHDMVNHSLNFVDPVTGVHIQNVESYWNRVKMKFKRMKGVHQEMLTSYMWMIHVA